MVDRVRLEHSHSHARARTLCARNSLGLLSQQQRNSASQSPPWRSRGSRPYSRHEGSTRQPRDTISQELDTPRHCTVRYWVSRYDTYKRAIDGAMLAKDLDQIGVGKVRPKVANEQESIDAGRSIRTALPRSCLPLSSLVTLSSDTPGGTWTSTKSAPHSRGQTLERTQTRARATRRAYLYARQGRRL